MLELLRLVKQLLDYFKKLWSNYDCLTTLYALLGLHSAAFLADSLAACRDASIVMLRAECMTQRLEVDECIGQ